MKQFLSGIVWFALSAILLGVAAVAVAIWWPERMALMWALGLFGIAMAVLSLQEKT